jgi:hypothetical protein
MPSGAAIKPTKTTFSTPFSFRREAATTAEPPVASMGSRISAMSTGGYPWSLS